jgi:hypothetical protein
MMSLKIIMAISFKSYVTMISFQVDTCRAFLVVTNPDGLTPPKYDGGTDSPSQQTMISSRGTLVHT